MRLSPVAGALAFFTGTGKYNTISRPHGRLALTSPALAQDAPFPTTCQGVPASRFASTVDPGWEVTKIAGNLRQPRTLVFDPLGHLLVLQSKWGISAHTFGEDGCISETVTVAQNIRFNHGLSLSPDGKKLYASSETNVWSWDYDAESMSVSNQKTVVKGISTGIHNTRTVHVVPEQPNLIVVSVGSNSNFDMDAGSMRATVRVFDAEGAPGEGWEFNSQGHQFGWGLRNSVALAFDPNGHVWAAENSADVSSVPRKWISGVLG